jgi:hypothetical protein
MLFLIVSCILFLFLFPIFPFPPSHFRFPIFPILASFLLTVHLEERGERGEERREDRERFSLTIPRPDPIRAQEIPFDIPYLAICSHGALRSVIPHQREEPPEKRVVLRRGHVRHTVQRLRVRCARFY